MVAVSAEDHGCKDWTGQDANRPRGSTDRKRETQPRKEVQAVAIDAKVAGLPGATARPRVFGFTDTTAAAVGLA